VPLSHDLIVFLVDEKHGRRVGALTANGSFAYDPTYVEREDAHPLSLSLPLDREAFAQAESRPYFEGLLPEHEAREALAAQLAVRSDDYLAMLEHSALDCIGDVAITADDPPAQGELFPNARFAAVTKNELRRALRSTGSVAQASLASRLSLSGTQRKLGVVRLARNGDTPTWYRPLDGAASTHIIKSGQLSAVPEYEFLALRAAKACGLPVPATETFDLENGSVALCIERFDRSLTIDEQGQPHVRRLHHEDLTQALGLPAGSKYAELEPTTARAVAELLRRRSSRPLADVRQLARLCLFNYLIGNCDNHLKNVSLMHSEGWVSLAPAYDLVPTTVFERFSHEMAMAIGSHRIIDEVTPEDLSLLARDLGLAPRMVRGFAAKLIDVTLPALFEAAHGNTWTEALHHDAENLADDMTSRLEVLRRFCTSST